MRLKIALYLLGVFIFASPLAAADARRKVQVIQKRTQSQDHPFLLAMPETYYLKCLFLRMLE